jgi:hypothetical protein
MPYGSYYTLEKTHRVKYLIGKFPLFYGDKPLDLSILSNSGKNAPFRGKNSPGGIDRCTQSV